MQSVIEKSAETIENAQSAWALEPAAGTNYGKGLLPREFILGLVAILFASAITYGSLAFFWTKFSRAEVFFAECAREMLVTHNFITPLYHAQPFFDKPIFVYWLIIGMFKTMGINHFAARLPSIVASLATILGIGIAGSFLFGRRTGLVAAAMLASAFMYLSFSSLCMSDMFLVLFDTLTLIFVFAGIQSEKHRDRNWWLAAVSMGFAFLTKGPVGIVLPAIASLIYMAMVRKIYLLKLKHFMVALGSIAVISSPWFYAAYLANGQEALVHFFIQENLQRFAGNTYDGHKPFWYTVVSFFFGFAPWSILLPPALFFFFKGINEWSDKIVCALKVSDDLHYEIRQSAAKTTLSFKMLPFLPLEASGQLFLWIWLAISVGFFCFSRGKCDYYTLPAYPAAAILCAQYVNRYFRKYLSASLVIAFLIGAGTTIFSVIALPKIVHLVPVSKYAQIIKNGPDNLQLGIDKTLSAWADEILFQSGKDPECFIDDNRADKFIREQGPRLVLMPQTKYQAMMQQLGERKSKDWKILACDPVATHSLTPGYFLSKQGRLVDDDKLVLATNFDESAVDTKIRSLVSP